MIKSRMSISLLSCFDADTTLLDMVSTYFLIKKFEILFVPPMAPWVVQNKFKYILMVQIKI